MWLLHTCTPLHLCFPACIFAVQSSVSSHMQYFHCACVCVPVSLQLSAVLSEGRPQVPGVPRGVVAHSSGSRNHDAFCRDRETERRLEDGKSEIPIRGENKESWNTWSLFRHPEYAAGQVDAGASPAALLFAIQCFGSSSHLLWQTGAGSSEVLHVRLGAALPFIQDEVCGHFALQTGDVAMAEVIAQVMHLRKKIHIHECTLLTPLPDLFPKTSQ